MYEDLMPAATTAKRGPSSTMFGVHRFSNLDPICVENLVSGMGSLTRSVKQVIAAEMPDRFGLIFDGWTHASEHYIAVYVRYEVDSNT
ncbi:hypothetical protein L917_00139, partial [Phytophthora nicotianae]